MWPSATPATQNEGECHQVPHLPRKVQRRHQRPSRPSVARCAISATPATHATQSEGGCHEVPRLPRKTKVDVTKCHACHVKRRRMSPSATPATQSEGGCHQVPRLPRKVPRRHRRPSCPSAPRNAISATPSCLPGKTKVDVTKCHGCHVKRRRMSPRATTATQNGGSCGQVLRLPRKTKVDATKCHACHAKCRGRHRRPSRLSAPRSVISATPATQSEGGCHEVPRLPRKTKEDVAKCRACHAKRRWLSPSATPTTQSAAAVTRDQAVQARHAMP